jgi:hypothetical protein
MDFLFFFVISFFQGYRFELFIKICVFFFVSFKVLIRNNEDLTFEGEETESKQYSVWVLFECHLRKIIQMKMFFLMINIKCNY